MEVDSSCSRSGLAGLGSKVEGRFLACAMGSGSGGCCRAVDSFHRAVCSCSGFLDGSVVWDPVEGLDDSNYMARRESQ